MQFEMRRALEESQGEDLPSAPSAVGLVRGAAPRELGLWGGLAHPMGRWLPWELLVLSSSTPAVSLGAAEVPRDETEGC